jgi:hypothetical protein
MDERQLNPAIHPSLNPRQTNGRGRTLARLHPEFLRKHLNAFGFGHADPGSNEFKSPNPLVHADARPGWAFRRRSRLHCEPPTVHRNEGGPRPEPARLLRAARQRVAGCNCRVPAPRRRLVRLAQDHCRACSQRQRHPYRSQFWASACGSWRSPARYTRSHRPRPTQGGGTDQNATARVGLSLRLPTSRHRARALPRLPPLVQPTPTTQRARRPTTTQPRLTRRWAAQLARDCDHADPRRRSPTLVSARTRVPAG